MNEAEPDLVVVAGDLTDDGYPYQYPLARQELATLSRAQVVRVPGSHDARSVGYLLYEDTFGARNSRERLDCGGLEVALVAVDSSKPDLDEGEIEPLAWIQASFTRGVRSSPSSTTSLSGRCSVVSSSATKSHRFADGPPIEKSPLTDSSRRPPPYHGHEERAGRLMRDSA